MQSSYLEVIQSTPTGPKAAMLLLDRFCCSRCVLRFLGHKDPATYSEPAPSINDLRSALAERHPDSIPTPDQMPATPPGPSSSSAPDPSPATPVCSVCLGACQLLDGPAVGSGYNARQIDTPGQPIAEDLERNNGLYWRLAGGGTERDVMEVARMEGHVFTDKFCVEAAVPAPTASRQFSTYLTLQKLLFGRYIEAPPRSHLAAQQDELAAAVLPDVSPAPSGPFSQPARRSVDAVWNLRDCLRLTIAHRICKENPGWSHDPDARMRISLFYCHRGSYRENKALNLPALANPKLKRKPDAHERERAERSKRIAAGLTPFASTPTPLDKGEEGGGAGTNSEAKQPPAKELARSPEYICRSATERVLNTLCQLRPDTLLSQFPYPPNAVSECAHLLVMPYRRPTYLGGYYQKKLRNISNSAWYLNANDRKGDGSVEEAIWTWARPFIRPDRIAFHSSGREDIDVRMLGLGRPFSIEIQNAREDPGDPLPSARWIQVEEQINGSGVVEVRKLRPCTKEEVFLIREETGDKWKGYRAVVWFTREMTEGDAAKLTAMEQFDIVQQTPTRVAHRRSDMARTKSIRNLRMWRVPGQPQLAVLDLECSSGTYVKEFVHGDNGRTTPSFGSLLGLQGDDAVEIIQLDVTQVFMEWI